MLILAASTGIGALLAQTLAIRNVTVINLTKSVPVDSEDNDNDNIHTYECDVSDWKQVEAVAARVRKEVSVLNSDSSFIVTFT